jgi:glycosyltransferase involved in cell wall biosynthesis
VVEYTEGGNIWHKLRPSIPYLTHLHGSRYTVRRMSGRTVGQADWYHRRLELFFIRRAQWVFSPSQALLDIVVEETGSPLPRATVIPYPLEPRLLEHNGTAASNPVAAKIVHFVARNDLVKGADTLLQAIPLVHREIPDAEFHFFGFEVTDLASVAEGIRCYGFLPKSQLFQHYQQADLCVVPSLWDNSPNTVYEAMATGKAIVASKVGGIPELVEDGKTGLIVPPSDPKMLAAAIIELLLNDKKRVEMGKRGFERIQQLADLQDNVEQRLAIYHQIINESN